MRRALVIGIDFYEVVEQLHGCVNDAHSVKSMLDRHADGSVNFGVKLMTGTGPKDLVSRLEIKEAARTLFSDGDGEVALFYFAGHGYIETTGGYLCGSDCKTGDDGLALHDIMVFANSSKFRNRIIILDSCHSGIAGQNPNTQSMGELTEGVTILTASSADQYATEVNGSGVFTTLLVDALSGAASNLVGDVSPGSAYSHIDQSLGPWGQRPLFKTNVKSFVSLRKVRPPLDLAELQRITEFFPSAGFQYPLDPTYEPERSSLPEPNIPDPDPDHTAIFAVLQKYNRVNLLIPEGAPHMWHAAMNSKTVRLTALGEHYRQLVSKGQI